MGKYYWVPSIEREIDSGRRYFGFRSFAFGVDVYLGKRTWFIRLAIPK